MAVKKFRIGKLYKFDLQDGILESQGAILIVRYQGRHRRDTTTTSAVVFSHKLGWSPTVWYTCNPDQYDEISEEELLIYKMGKGD
jgi:hypothetical protein